MSRLMYLDSTVVSHNGMLQDTNEDNFYVNGRYKHDYEKNNTQISVEENGESFVYGICAGKSCQIGEEPCSVEIIKTLKYYHEKVMANGGDIDSKLGLLEESVEEAGNVLFSKSINKPEHGQPEVDFAGAIMTGGKIAAVNVGKCGVYLHRDGVFKQLTNEFERANKLVKMGILSNEQAKKISGKKLKLSVGNDKIHTSVSEPIKVKEQDVFVLCNEGLLRDVDEEKIKHILGEKKKSEQLANLLIKEVRKNFDNNSISDNMVVIVIKVDKMSNTKQNVSENKIKSMNSWGVAEKPKKKTRPVGDIVKAVVITATICVLCAIVYINYFSPKPSVTLPPDVLVADPGPKEYIVKEEDTIESISKDFYGDEKKYTLIMKMNDLKNAKDIKVGQVLKLYPEATISDKLKTDEENKDDEAKEKTIEFKNGIAKYTVKDGDTLGSISQKFYGTILKYKLIMEHNNIKSESALKVGKEIEIVEGKK